MGGAGLTDSTTGLVYGSKLQFITQIGTNTLTISPPEEE